MFQLLVLLVVPLAALAAPQVGFGDASDQEIAEIRAGSYLETVDDNPQYNFQYKVANLTYFPSISRSMMLFKHFQE